MGDRAVGRDRAFELAGAQVPHADRLVLAARDHARAGSIGGQTQIGDGTFVAVERGPHAARRDVPHPDRAAVRARDHALAVRREDRANTRPFVRQRVERRRGERGQLDRDVDGAGGRRERELGHRAAATRHLRGLGLRLGRLDLFGLLLRGHRGLRRRRELRDARAQRVDLATDVAFEAAFQLRGEIDVHRRLGGLVEEREVPAERPEPRHVLDELVEAQREPEHVRLVDEVQRRFAAIEVDPESTGLALERDQQLEPEHEVEVIDRLEHVEVQVTAVEQRREILGLVALVDLDVPLEPALLRAAEHRLEPDDRRRDAVRSLHRQPVAGRVELLHVRGQPLRQHLVDRRLERLQPTLGGRTIVVVAVVLVDAFVADFLVMRPNDTLLPRPLESRTVSVAMKVPKPLARRVRGRMKDSRLCVTNP